MSRDIALAAGLLLACSGCRPAQRSATPSSPPRESVDKSERPAKSEFSPAPLATPQSRSSDLPLRSFDDLLALPDDQFDLGEAVLALGQEGPTGRSAGDPLKSLSELDRLADAVRADLPQKPDAIDYIDALYSVALDRRAADPFRDDRAEDYDLTYTIDKKRGACLSVGIKTLAVARRVGAPLYGAQAPGHFLLRSVESSSRTPVNFDVTRPSPDNWRRYDDDYFRRWYHFDSRGQNSAGYLKPLTDKQVVAVFLASRSGFLALQKSYDASLKDAQRALSLNPRNTTATLNCGFALESLDRLNEAEEQYRRALEIDAQSIRAMNNLAYLKVKDPNSEVYDPKEAEKLIDRALKAEPNRAYLHATYGEIKAARQDWRAAARELQEAMRLDKKNDKYRKRFMELRAHLRNEDK